MLLSEVSTFVADRERAAILYDLLSPFEDRNITLFHAASFGCAATYLGKLATVTNRLEQAEKHFEHALAVNESMGAIPWLADTQYEYARMLLSRGRDTPDRKRAQALLAQAHSTARQIGYSRLVSLIGNLETKDSYQRDRFTTPAPLSPATRSADDHSCAFYREGEFWTIVYNGHAVRLRHAKGLSYIHKLLTQPNNAIHVFELARQGQSRNPRPNGVPDSDAASFALTDAGEVLDSKAKSAYRHRIFELRAELEDSKRTGQISKAVALEAEKDAIVQALRRAAGLGGRSRRAASIPDRARVAVTKAIRAAIQKIDQHDPALAEFLTRSIRTGTFCRYTVPAAEAPGWAL